ncbi:competence type IV pilus assembly protein ComGB [Anaerobacillus sp. MEB173]|uniref:competence type IV pilus assembly protein ComGB n=1 Tax=Anaerobacillus sp. MEB173 TaxID=3383345 RepID=UPI003F90C5DD
MKHKWSQIKKAEFLVQLGMFLEQGYTLADTILLLKYYQPKEVRAQLDVLIQKLREGSTIHEGLHELQFPKDVLGYLYFSEKNGELAKGFIEGGRLLAKREEIKEKLQKLLRYPLFMLWLLIVIAFIMLHYLFPHFQSLFESLNIELPLITRLFLKMVSLTPLFVSLFIFINLLAFCYYYFSYRHYHPSKQISLLLRIPILNVFLKLMLTHYFTVQLGRILKGGLSVYEAMTIFEEQDQLPFFQHEGLMMKMQLKCGEKLEEVVRGRNYIQKELPFIVSHGQANGSLSHDLLHYSEVLLAVIEEKAKKLTLTVQPILFLVIGLVVMFMFLSVMLPMFQLISSL